MIDVMLPKNERCEFCRKRKAVSLCDMPSGTIGSTITGVPGRSKLTCDAKICEVCRIHITQNFELCPVHAREVFLMLQMNQGDWKPKKPGG